MCFSDKGFLEIYSLFHKKGSFHKKNITTDTTIYYTQQHAPILRQYLFKKFIFTVFSEFNFIGFQKSTQLEFELVLRIPIFCFCFVFVQFSEQLWLFNGQVDDSTAGDFFSPTLIHGTEHGSHPSLTTRDRDLVSVLEVRIEPGDLNQRPLTPQSVTLPTQLRAGCSVTTAIYKLLVGWNFQLSQCNG